MKTSRAIPTTRPPQGANHCWLGGVQSLARAEAWAERNGYETVYYVAPLNRIYYIPKPKQEASATNG
jgi:hypothetical protein